MADRKPCVMCERIEYAGELCLTCAQPGLLYVKRSAVHARSVGMAPYVCLFCARLVLHDQDQVEFDGRRQHWLCWARYASWSARETQERARRAEAREVGT